MTSLHWLSNCLLHAEIAIALKPLEIHRETVHPWAPSLKDSCEHTSGHYRRKFNRLWIISSEKSTSENRAYTSAFLTLVNYHYSSRLRSPIKQLCNIIITASNMMTALNLENASISEVCFREPLRNALNVFENNFFILCFNLNNTLKASRFACQER